MGKSLRTIQKHETEEIEMPLSAVSQLAGVLSPTSSYILGFDRGPTTDHSMATINIDDEGVSNNEHGSYCV